MGCAFQNGTERSKITCRDMKNHHLCISVIICLLPVNDVTYIERLWFGAIEGCSFFIVQEDHWYLFLNILISGPHWATQGPKWSFSSAFHIVSALTIRYAREEAVGNQLITLVFTFSQIFGTLPHILF